MRWAPVGVFVVVAATSTGCAAPGVVAGAQVTSRPRVTALVPTPTVPPTPSVGFRAAADGTVLPDPELTPGDVVPGSDVVVLCAPGFGADAHRVRSTDKDRALAAYEVEEFQGEFTIDHLVPVELGGSDAAANLWPQPRDGAFAAVQKNELENRLHELVCQGVVPLEEARAALVADWRAAYDRYPPTLLPAVVTGPTTGP